MGTNSSKNTFRNILSKSNPAGRGGSTNSPKGEVGTAALGTSSTNPTSKTGKQERKAKG